jgi:predicted DNA-binding mobile mystery protein A
MKESKKRLLLDQLDEKFSKLKEFDITITPIKGWTCSIRTALNMSLKQLGNRMKMTPQSTKEIEEREKNRSITLKGLNDAAEALNMRMVYFFIPKTASLQKMIENRAYEIAEEIVLKTSHSMGLEDQQNRDERLKKAIKDRAEKIMNELPRFLWD